MKKYLYRFMLISFFSLVFLPSSVLAGSCGCTLTRYNDSITVKTCSDHNDMTENDCSKISNQAVMYGGQTVKTADGEVRLSRDFSRGECSYYETNEACVSQFLNGEPPPPGLWTQFINDLNRAIAEAQKNAGSATPGVSAPAGSAPVESGAFLPECAIRGDCRSVNDLVLLMVNIGEYIFGIIGSIAFVVFIYGGFTVATSFGNTDKVKQGYQTLAAALIGMSIAFGAYIMIDFLLDALQVQEGFRMIQ